MKPVKCPKCGKTMQFPKNLYLGIMVCPDVFCSYSEFERLQSLKPISMEKK